MSFPIPKPRTTKLWYTICVTDECIERAKADIEATGESSSDRRLRAAFGGERAPTVEIAAGETFGDWLKEKETTK